MSLPRLGGMGLILLLSSRCLIGAVDPRVSYQAVPATMTTGDTGSYRLAVTNPGPQAIRVYARATLPGPSVFKFSTEATGCGPVEVSPLGFQEIQTITCDLGVLPVGGAAALSFEGKIYDLGAWSSGMIVWDETGAVWSTTGAALTVLADKGVFQVEPYTYADWVDTGESGMVTLKIYRVSGTAGTVGVDYYTSPGSATEGVDYVGKRGTATFTNGEYVKSIQVEIRTDTTTEYNETFSLQLTNATGGAVVHPLYQKKAVRIIDDDLSVSGTVECVSCYPDSPTTTIEWGGSSPFLSHDGQRVLFATQFAAPGVGDQNGQADIYLRKTNSAALELVSVNRFKTGSGNGPSPYGKLSADGRWAVFSSQATDLVTNQVSGATDLYARDLVSGETQLVSVNGNGRGGAASSGSGFLVSSNGDWVIFESLAGDLVSGSPGRGTQIYARHLPSGITRRVATSLDGTGGANQDCYLNDISGDGRYVLFNSAASDLVAGDINGKGDVFVRDIIAGTTMWVTPGLDSIQFCGPTGFQISLDGHFVLFKNCYNVYLRDLVLATNHWIGKDEGYGDCCSMSPDGRYVAVIGIVTNLVAGASTPVRGVFLRDMATGAIRVVNERFDGGLTPKDTWYISPRVSDDGRYVAFSGTDPGLVSGIVNSGLNVFRRDLLTATTDLLSINYAHTGTAYGNSRVTQISGDGRVVLFYSDSAELTLRDQNAKDDVFVWRKHPPGPNTEIRTTAVVVGYGTNRVFLAVGVTNFGPDQASGVMVTTAFPSGLVPLSATTESGACDVQPGSVVCHFDWAARQGSSIQITASSIITNQVSVTASAVGAEPDPLPANNAASVSVQPGVIGQPRIDMHGSARFVPSTIVAGQTTSLILTVTNAGTEPDRVYARFGHLGSQVVSMPDACDVVDGVVTCSLGTVSGLESATVAWQFQLFDPGPTGTVILLWGDSPTWQRYIFADLTVTDGPGQLSWENSSYWLKENGEEIRLTVVRSAGSVGAVSVDYVTSPDTARPDIDYISTSGTLTFQEGETTKTIAVRAIPDSEAECHESFTVHLSNPSGGAILKPDSDPMTRVYIADDDARPRGTVEGVTVYPDYPWATVSYGGSTVWPTSVNQAGTKIAFTSDSGDFSAVDRNSQTDVFVRDLTAGTTTLVSINRFGNGSGNAMSRGGSISGDGRWMVFTSYAADLVTNQTSGSSDVFLRDLLAGTTRLVSVSTNGDRGGEGESRLDESLRPNRRTISQDGNVIVFLSQAPDLAPGRGQLFVRNVASGVTRRVVSSSEGSQGEFEYYNVRDLSPDGRYVLWESPANNLVPEDQDNLLDVFVTDLVASKTILVSKDQRGLGSQISADGRFVLMDRSDGAVESGANSVFLRDLQQGTTEVITIDQEGHESLERSSQSSMSPDARYVVFVSEATNLVAGDHTIGPKVFLRDRTAGTIEIASIRCDGVTTTGTGPQVSDDGRFVIFESTDVPPAKLNPSLFRRDRQEGVTELLTINYDGTGGATNLYPTPFPPTWSKISATSGDGRTVVFYSVDADMVIQDRNQVPDVFVWRQHPTGLTSDLRVSIREESSATNLIFLTIGVTNFGPDKATGVSVTNIFPPGIQPLTGTSSAGTFSIQPMRLVWTVSELDVRQGAVLQLIAFSSVRDPAQLMVSVQGQQFDSLTWNDHSQVDVQPGPPVPLPGSHGLSIAAYDPYLIVRWLSSPPEFLLEQTPSLTPPAQWKSVDGWVDDGLVRTWLGTNGTPPQFFRLRQP